MKKSIIRSALKICGLIAILLFFSALPAAPHDEGEAASSHDHHMSHEPHTVAGQWEGSPEGKAYSELNHHVAGIFMIVIGLSEMRHGFAPVVTTWTRLLLPFSLMAVGVFLLIWSDHKGWPFGGTFMQTFITGEWETVQHKWFGVLALSIGVIEWLRRTGKSQAMCWKIPLPVFAIIGGLSLFLHSHGAHPSAHKIALHHAVMGIMAVTAGSSKFLSDWKAPASSHSPWNVAWAALVLLIGVQLLIYSE